MAKIGVKQNYAEDREKQKSKQKEQCSEQSSEPSSHSDSWPSSKEPKHDYVYKVAMIGVKYKLFASWTSTVNHHIGESTLFPEVMARAFSNHPHMIKVLGDGIYANRPTCKIVGKYGVIPIFLMKSNSTPKSKGVKPWWEMTDSLIKDPQTWLWQYHIRSISETGFSMINRANPQPLRKRLDRRRVTEDRLRGLSHNLKRLCYLPYTDGIKVTFKTGH